MKKPADLDPGKYDRYMQGLRDQQNLVAGLLGGIAAAAVGAVLWAAATYLTDYKLGAMSLLLGFLVGMAVLKLGRGVDVRFRILGAVLAFLSCLVGDLLAGSVYIAKSQGMAIPDVLSALGPKGMIGFAKESILEGESLLFYAIAVYEGYKLSAKKLTQADYLKISEMP
jgi:hypothetical protein